VTAAGVGAGGYTWLIEPHWEQVIERAMPITGLPDEWIGRKVIQLSDLHVGPRVDDDHLISAFARAAVLRPDVVVVTGDFLTYVHSLGEAQFDHLRDVIAHLPKGRLATVAILGNHDYGRGWRETAVADRVVSIVERFGVQVLRNESIALGGLDVVGVDDLWAHRADAALALGRRTSPAAIVLCHNPDALDDIPWNGYVGWILAGHTHGGQCKPPFLPPPILPVKNARYAAGEVHLADGRRVYVNRGLGHLIRVRFNVRPEITAFTLARA
jgi:predicted MPP superfamily phosphohydrolase